MNEFERNELFRRQAEQERRDARRQNEQEQDRKFWATMHDNLERRVRQRDEENRQRRENFSDFRRPEKPSKARDQGKTPNSEAHPLLQAAVGLVAIAAFLFWLLPTSVQSFIRTALTSSTETVPAAPDNSSKTFAGETTSFGSRGLRVITFAAVPSETFSPDADAIGRKYAPPFVVQMPKSTAGVIREITVARLNEMPWISRMESETSDLHYSVGVSFLKLKRYSWVIECVYNKKAGAAQEQSATYWYQATPEDADGSSLKSISPKHPLLAIRAPRHSCPTYYAES